MTSGSRGVPLHAGAERPGRILYGFDQTVGRRCRDDEPLADLPHGLMMTAVYGTRVAVDPLPQDAVQLRPFGDPDIVRNRVRRLAHFMLDGVWKLARNVLHERSAARHVQHLNPAADRKQRNVCVGRSARQLDFVGIATRLSRLERRMGLLAVQRRLNVVTAGQQDAVHFRHHGRGGVRGVVEDTHLAACAADSLLVVMLLGARGDSDDRHGAYILAGTATPIRSRAWDS